MRAGTNLEGAGPRIPRKLINTLLEIGVLIAALGMGVAMRFHVYESMMVISGSMKPTMQVGERFIVDHRASLRGKWQRGDVVLFQQPPSWGTDEGDTLVKRVIGLPGEVVTLADGKIYINDQPLTENYLPADVNEESAPIVRLGADEYYLLGDNRNNSDDSRENGPVAGQYIRGRIVLRLWPPGRFESGAGA